MKQKNPRASKITGCFLLLILLLIMPATSYATEDITINLPLMENFTPALTSNGSPRYMTAREIEQTFKRYSPEFRKIYYNHDISKFILPSHDWLERLKDVYAILLKLTYIQGKAETWDCENYSQLLNALTTVRIWKAGYYDTRATIGWMQVDAKYEWAGLPGELHALLFAVTENGFFVIEPQNGQTVRLEEYPNKRFIQEVYLF